MTVSHKKKENLLSELRKLSIPVLQDKSIEIQEDMIGIKYQLNRAKEGIFDAEFKEDPNFNYNEWYSKAKYALQIKGLQHQTILRVLADKNKAEKERLQNTQDKTFISIAKERLDPELFYEIMEDAISATS